MIVPVDIKISVKIKKERSRRTRRRRASGKRAKGKRTKSRRRRRSREKRSRKTGTIICIYIVTRSLRIMASMCVNLQSYVAHAALFKILLIYILSFTLVPLEKVLEMNLHKTVYILYV